MIATIILTAIAFVSTNIDDAFVLLAFFSDQKFKAMHIVIGQYLGIGALVLVALVIGYFALIVPDKYIGLMGILPILIGLKQLWSAWWNRAEEHDAPHQMNARGAIAAVASVTIANGGDNIAVYVPLFAKQTSTEIALTCAVFAILTAVWCALGKLLVAHPAIGAPIRKWGHRAVPFVLIGIGLYILFMGGIFEVR